jgi:hypothetical protein
MLSCEHCISGLEVRDVSQHGASCSRVFDLRKKEKEETNDDYGLDFGV